FEESGNGLTGQVVRRGPETPARNHEIGPLESLPQDRAQVLRVVAHYGLGANVDPDVVEAAREKERIRVEAMQTKELGANGQDLSRLQLAHQSPPGTVRMATCRRRFA